MGYSLYTLQSEQREIYYIGVSDNPERRLRYHNCESKGHTRQNRPWELVYTCQFEFKEEATKLNGKWKVGREKG